MKRKQYEMRRNLALVAICFASLIGLSFSCSKESTEPARLGGVITFTINGVTVKETDDVSAVFTNGKFAGCTDGNGGAKIGDSEKIELTPGNVKPLGCIVEVNGVMYARPRQSATGTGVMLTIVSYDGKTLKATFAGNVYKDGDYKNGLTPITGSLEVSDILKI